MIKDVEKAAKLFERVAAIPIKPGDNIANFGIAEAMHYLGFFY